MYSRTKQTQLDISTHSLTRRLTKPGLKKFLITSHFNSQPHEEADRHLQLSRFQCGYFNSQPHEEADEPVGTRPVRTGISTHSLTRRLTITLLTR